ncbi:MAG: DNA mismatch repair endonuclease MutL [Bacteroidales bacterium]|nr:DNA mismatch repair endonuclease MutL [Bacteroidales bacterium]
MSDIIKVLPDSVANQIAAGEVIQRPASVIKELVENSIDAKATQVQIILKEAGRTLIQVIDNGIGMTDTDARLSFERHSTSKIRKADDLFALHTNGFRGEALASIAAISQIELRTCCRGADLGTHIIISASQCESQEPDVCQSGSNFMVKNIFYNVPARRKFLKSNSVELSNIVKEFEKLALVNPTVEFTLVHNDSVMYKLGSGSFKQRIKSLFSRNLDQQLIPISIDTDLVKIEGFVSKPENVRKRNFLQYLFVNGRFMRHPYFHKAIVASYEQLIPEGTQPNYFLNFTVDPETIDVNIHPTKTEIKFENEQPIWQILSAAVKESLGRFSVAPTIDFDTVGALDMPAYQPLELDNIEAPRLDIDPTYNPFNAERKPATARPSQGGGSYAKSHPAMDWESLYENFESSKLVGLDAAEDEPAPAEEPEQAAIDCGDDGAGDSAVMMQIKGRYIVQPVRSGLMLVDQHRAHVRVLYDRYIKQVSNNSIVSQSVLFPEVLHLSQSQHLIMAELCEEIEKVGFSLSSLSGTDWSVSAIPAGVENVDVKDLLLQVIDSIIEGGDSIASRVFEHIALTVAERAAIPYGKVLNNGEMEALIGDLLRLPQPNYTPAGKTVICMLPLDRIDGMFS